jgi:hypothetical protein
MHEFKQTIPVRVSAPQVLDLASATRNQRNQSAPILMRFGVMVGSLTVERAAADRSIQDMGCFDLTVRKDGPIVGPKPGV